MTQHIALDCCERQIEFENKTVEGGGGDGITQSVFAAQEQIVNLWEISANLFIWKKTPKRYDKTTSVLPAYRGIVKLAEAESGACWLQYL